MFHVLGYGIPKFRSISTGCVKSPIFTNFPDKTFLPDKTFHSSNSF